ncbi:MAG: hypothetical protein IT440_07485 [Phycisphaeraceae bacterium]|nr:hypothetical protein [Phycisphaeraceae bacterium]
MGLDLTYDADGATFTHRFSHADWYMIEALRAHLPEQVGICFDVPELGELVRIKTAALKQSALEIDRFLAGNAQILPATYQFKLERFPVPGVPAGGFVIGGISGLHLPNDPDHVYCIDAGLNELRLKKMAVGAVGKGVIVDDRDMRNETELVTESAGKVQFRRRAAKTTLRRALREIAAYADCVASDELTKVVG